MERAGAAEPLSLRQLVEPIRWQRLQDHFARVLGITLRTIASDHELLSVPSWPSGVDPDSAIGLLKIGEELDALVPPQRPPQYTANLTTPLGVTYAAVPIRATADQIVAYFVTGPLVVGPREDEVQFHRRVAALGQDARALWPLILSLRLYTFAGIRSALNLIEEVGTSIAELAYQANQFGTVLPSSTKIDQAVLTYHTDRILHSLLEAATLAIRADGGSIMLYDGRRELLQMKTALGLSESVVSATRLKRGEGIAGLAAEQRNILVVDAQVTDERIRNRMRRPELTSSLVAPLVPDASQDPIGVLSLRTANPQRQFTEEHVELLRRLLDLACIALGSLRSVFVPSPHAS
ncbi:MAG: GAF domain-containing protein [Candidatus Omnitrophica bacterium]|nr:GAF domain-containing protein [Candidatus Omnitrophota bacterium]